MLGSYYFVALGEKRAIRLGGGTRRTRTMDGISAHIPHGQLAGIPSAATHLPSGVLFSLLNRACACLPRNLQHPTPGICLSFSSLPGILSLSRSSPAAETSSFLVRALIRHPITRRDYTGQTYRLGELTFSPSLKVLTLITSPDRSCFRLATSTTNSLP